MIMRKKKRDNLTSGVGGAGHAWVWLRNGREKGRKRVNAKCDDDVDERDKVDRPRLITPLPTLPLHPIPFPFTSLFFFFSFFFFF